MGFQWRKISEFLGFLNLSSNVKKAFVLWIMKYLVFKSKNLPIDLNSTKFFGKIRLNRFWSELTFQSNFQYRRWPLEVPENSIVQFSRNSTPIRLFPNQSRTLYPYRMTGKNIMKYWNEY